MGWFVVVTEENGSRVVDLVGPFCSHTAASQYAAGLAVITPGPASSR